MLTLEDRDLYERDGVICLRNVISKTIRETAHKGMQHSIAHPGLFFRDYTAEGSPARCIFEYWNWWNIQEFKTLAFDSTLTSILADLMGADRLTLLMDQWFMREAGATNAANWHHDELYFDFFEGKKAVVWFPLEDTTAEEGLTFVKGSHLWGKLYMAQNFGKRQAFDGDMTGYTAPEDFDQYHEDLVSFDMKAGDCLIFDFRTLHRATSDTKPLAKTSHRISYRYGDQDILFRPRGQWTSEISAFLMDGGQEANAPLDCHYLPEVFNRFAISP